ncbi:hypothetical protein ABG067_001653 [Albugo candida]
MRLGWRQDNVRLISHMRLYSISSKELRNILENVKSGALSPVEAADSIAHTYQSKPSYDSVEKYAKLDRDRKQRTGFPEVVYAEGKSYAQMATILENMMRRPAELVMATRVNKIDALQLLRRPILQNLEYYETARILSNKPTGNALRRRHTGSVSVLCAGTSDLQVAEEAAITLEIGGHRVERSYDVGVAGIHRLFQNLDKVSTSSVAICVAGMDGALPSVLGGLISIPIIAVPTSVGYGAAFAGLAPLLTMLNSCSPGVSVVNIDNGFGAAICADRMLRLSSSE